MKRKKAQPNRSIEKIVESRPVVTSEFQCKKTNKVPVPTEPLSGGKGMEESYPGHTGFGANIFAGRT